VITSADLTPGGLTGRAAETAAIRRALTDPAGRVVTVTGLPGVGKSAASVAAAAAAAARFRDGAWLIRLDALRDEELLPHTIAAAMRLPDRFRDSPLRRLTAHLAGLHVLLVLDTCEHVIGACAGLVDEVRRTCPGVRVLATSREPLRVPGEERVTVPPLPARDAQRLFTRRASEQAETRPGARGRDTVRAICERLDGLPLAIGMAARQLAAGSLDALLAGLQNGYEFLSDPTADTPRHQTLQAAIGWSHELCTPAERLLWARLSVFEGSFSIKDCQEVCAATHLTDEEVSTGVAMLAERSVLIRASGENEEPRYLLPATLRAYGAGMLRRLAEEDEMRRRYRNWRSGPRRDATYW
jgi:predicted ATPase